MKNILLTTLFSFCVILLNAQSYDMAATAISVPSQVKFDDAPFNLTGTFKNIGTEVINSFDLNYSLNGGDVQTNTISNLTLNQFDNYNFTRFNGFSPFMPGRYTITVWASNLNGNADENSVNDSISKTITVTDEQVERNAFNEVFTSSTCGPCRPGNVNTDAVWAASSRTPVIIKYQMSWPGTGDPYYTAEGNVRRNYYNVNSVPNMQIDGGWNGNSNSYTATILDQFSDIPAFLELESNFTVTGKTVDMNFALKPLIDILGNNRLFVAIIEKTTDNNIKSNGETVFYDVMKKMVPDASGTALGSIQKGVPMTFNMSYTFQGNYRLPANANSPINHATEHSIEEFTDLGVIVWVQNVGSKDVFHSTYSTEKATGTDLELNNLSLADSVGITSNVTISGEVKNNQSTSITSFDIVYKVNGGTEFRNNISGVNLASGASMTFNHSDIWVPGAAGFYKVEARIDNVNGAGVDVNDDLALNDGLFKYVIAASGITGLPSYEVAKTISVYPNPSSGIVNIKSESSFAKSVVVYDLMGKELQTLKMGNTGFYTLDMSGYAQGTYILKFNTEDGGFSDRVVIE